LKLYFDDVAFDGQLQRSVGKSDSGMANVGECLAIAGQITPGDRDSWYQAWSGFAAHLVSQAGEAAKAGHRVSARGAYLRAAEYFRRRSSSTARIWTGTSCEVSPGQGKVLFDHLTCPKEFRLFTKAEGAEGHCEGMAPIVFWDAAFNWLDSQLTS
jgi:hypothetical protein